MANFVPNNNIYNPNSNETIRIGTDDYIFEVFLTNTNGDMVKINHAAIKELVIDDMANNFYHFGSLTYQNDYDAMEANNGLPSVDNTNVKDYTQIPNLQYRFRGDSRDFLIINILPKLPNVPYDANNIDAYKRVFNLKFVFCIYDTQDISGESATEKWKKLFFWDWSFQILNEKNVDYSTADSIKDANVINMSNDDRADFTGKAIKDFLNTAFPTSEGYVLTFSPDWDNGGAKVFYSSPAGYNGIDDLHFLLKHHVSTSDNNYDFCLLDKDRYTEAWSLISMKKYFDNAYKAQANTQNSNYNTDSDGNLMMEKFYIANQDDKVGLPDNPQRVSQYENNSVYLLDYSNLDTYTFKNTSGLDVQKRLVSSIVHSVNLEEGKFYMDFSNNNIESARNVFYNNYVKNMKGANGKNPSSNLTVNQYRETQKNVKHVFTTSTESHEGKISFGRNDILKSAIFLNNSVTFRVKGSTHRRTKRFITIDIRHNTPNCNFYDKFLGIYFVIEVKHIFDKNTYFNELVCVKTYNFKDLGYDTKTI